MEVLNTGLGCFSGKMGEFWLIPLPQSLPGGRTELVLEPWKHFGMSFGLLNPVSLMSFWGCLKTEAR